MKGGECAGVCDAHHFTATKKVKHMISRHGFKLGELLNTAQATGYD